MLPTHFYVPKNDSTLTKTDLQLLTYSLCHFYFNWAGPIKVPAPCQYAHKIAEFFMNIGANKKKGQNKFPSCKEALMLKQRVEQSVEPLNNRLHFL